MDENKAARVYRYLHDAAVLSGRPIEDIAEECRRLSTETLLTYEDAAEQAMRLATVAGDLYEDERVRLIISSRLSTGRKYYLINEIRKAEELKNIDLFGNEVEVPDPPKGRKKTPRMQEIFGTEDGKTCRDCAHCFAYTQSRTWYKCELWLKICFPNGGHSEASDIRLKDTACRKFEEGGAG